MQMLRKDRAVQCRVTELKLRSMPPRSPGKNSGIFIEQANRIGY